MSQVFFRKNHEDDLIVRYSFGQVHLSFARTLSVEKESQRFPPDDGVADREFRQASWGIMDPHIDDSPGPSAATTQADDRRQHVVPDGVPPS